MLKLDPKNTELLTQKQTVLNESIKTTQEKIKELEKIKAEADKAMAEGTKIDEENYRYLQREIINTQNKLSDLKNEASNWKKAGDALVEWGENLNKIGEKIDNLGSKLTTSLTVPIAGIAAAGLTYDAQIEKYETAFKTFLGSAEEAEKAIENLKDDAKKTPFDTTSLVRANQMLISTGVGAEDAREDIISLGEAIVATGGGNDELVRMASNLQQIKNAGKATSMDIRQFAYAGIDVYGILADYTGKNTEEIKNMEISYDDLTQALRKAKTQGGKYYGALENSTTTLTGQVSALKSEVQDGIGDLTKSLMPVAKKVVSKARDIIKQFDKLSDSQKDNIVKIGLMVAAAGPLLKLGGSAISIVGNVSKGIGTFTQAIALAHNGIGTATGSAATLAKVLQSLTSPAGIAAAGITAAVGIMIVELKKSEKAATESLKNISDGVDSFNTGIQTAESYLDHFNSTLFVSSEEQQELEKQMDEVQQGITNICKTASEERRGYTEEEVKQLDDYFKKLRELKDKEIEIQKKISEAIAIQAKTDVKNFQGSLEEYQELSSSWIKTAEENKDKTVKLIEEGTIQEIVLLNERYKTEEERQSEAYKKEYESIIEHKNIKIQEANDELKEITKIYSDEYYQRSELSNKLKEQTIETNKNIESENERHNKAIQELNGRHFDDYNEYLKEVERENYHHIINTEKVYDKLYENMSESEKKQLGYWMATLADTEMYGNEISEENQKIIDTILASYDYMPNEAKNTMNQTMNGMLDGMKEKEPTLYAKASGIASSILSKLRNAFDIHSPSRETRDIFQNVMKGAELGLTDEENKLNSEIEKITDKMKMNLNNIVPNIQGIKQSVIDRTNTVFTTPQIVFNVQELDESKLQQCFNYINKKFGSAY